MPTNTTQSSDSTTDSTETEEQDTQSTEQQDTEETSEESTDTTQSQDDATSDPKPADKKDPAKQALLADLHKERKALKTASTELTALKTEVEELRPIRDTLDAVQTKYDRLEAFLQAAGGPLGKALDSKSFTTALFESDKDISEIVKEWNAANPSATSTALGSAAAAPAGKAPSMNDLLRSAIK